MAYPPPPPQLSSQISVVPSFLLPLSSILSKKVGNRSPTLDAFHSGTIHSYCSSKYGSYHGWGVIQYTLVDQYPRYPVHCLQELPRLGLAVYFHYLHIIHPIMIAPYYGNPS